MVNQNFINYMQGYILNEDTVGMLEPVWFK